MAAFVAGGSARAASSRSESDGMAEAQLGGRRERRRKTLERAVAPGAPGRRRAAPARNGSDGRGSRGRRWPAGWRPPAARRRAHAPRARERSRSLRRRRGTPRSRPSSSRRRPSGTSRSIDPHAHARRGGDAADERGAGVERRRAPRDAASAARSASRRRGTPRAGTRDRQQARATTRPGGRSSGSPSRETTPASVSTSIAWVVPSTRSWCARLGRTRVGWYVRISDSTRSARRIANARRATDDSARSRWNEARRVRAGAPCRRCGTARRSRRAGRSGAPARSRRARRARRRRAAGAHRTFPRARAGAA